MGVQINSISERLIFNNAKRALAKAGMSTKTARLTQSFLRLEQPLAVGKTNYLFPIMINQNAPQIFNTETRLNLQDSFVLSSLQFYVALPSGANDGTFKKLSYPNPFIFTNALQMNALYNGNMTLAVDNITYIPAWDLERHLYVPQTQQTSAAPAAGSPLDQYSGSVDAYYPVEPNVILIGSKNVVLSINLPVGLTAVDANSRIGFQMHGILAQNSTSVN